MVTLLLYVCVHACVCGKEVGREGASFFILPFWYLCVGRFGPNCLALGQITTCGMVCVRCVL